MHSGYGIARLWESPPGMRPLLALRRLSHSAPEDHTMPKQLLDELLAGVGEPPAASHVSFTGADPILPLPLRVGDVSAATLGAIGYEAARIWEMRTGRMQDVHIDVDAAAVALRSQGFIRPEPVPGQVEPTFGQQRREKRVGMGSGIVPAKDGRWVFLHREFAHHRERIEKLLGTPNDEEAIRKAVAGWDAFELEDAIFAAGACGAAVRAYAEWDATEQARILDKQPLIHIDKIGDSPPEPAGSGDRPLSGVRVLDLTRVIAGPSCARTLAEHGADVLRIANGVLDDNQVQRMDTGHGKRSTILDIRAEAD